VWEGRGLGWEGEGAHNSTSTCRSTHVHTTHLMPWSIASAAAGVGPTPTLVGGRRYGRVPAACPAAMADADDETSDANCGICDDTETARVTIHGDGTSW
jgi:hypothetical protein